MLRKISEIASLLDFLRGYFLKFEFCTVAQWKHTRSMRRGVVDGYKKNIYNPGYINGIRNLYSGAFSFFTATTAWAQISFLSSRTQALVVDCSVKGTAGCFTLVWVRVCKAVKSGNGRVERCHCQTGLSEEWSKWNSFLIIQLTDFPISHPQEILKFNWAKCADKYFYHPTQMLHESAVIIHKKELRNT